MCYYDEAIKNDKGLFFSFLFDFAFKRALFWAVSVSLFFAGMARSLYLEMNGG